MRPSLVSTPLEFQGRPHGLGPDHTPRKAPVQQQFYPVCGHRLPADVKHGCVEAFKKSSIREHFRCAPIRRTNGDRIRIVLQTRYIASPTLRRAVPPS